MERVLNIPELAAALRCSVPVAYQTVRSGKLSAARGGKQWRIAESAVQRFLNGGGGSVEPGKPAERPQAA